MRVLKWLLGIVAVLALLFVAGGYLLPREVTVARSVEIDAPPAEVFPQVNSLRAAQAWSPWLSRDPDVALVFSGPEEGVGAVMSWTSTVPEVGEGRQEIVASEPDRRVESALDFGQMGTARARLVLEAAGQGGTSSPTWARGRRGAGSG